ncbi:MAG: winged helix-turn-helix transcriptional regulator [Anaerolineales bacterium]|nr:winged helix-turn-helix transcriptional regulator [Anaerolineales bacterium]
MDDSISSEYTRGLLEAIEHDPDITQASLARRLGVAVGTVNWHLKRLIAKGYIKAKRAERKKLRYIITPEGIALRAKLTVAYVESSMQLYRAVRSQARSAIKQAKAHGYDRVAIEGQGDIADVCRLTCIEMDIQPEMNASDGLPILHIEGSNIHLRNLGDLETTSIDDLRSGVNE